ncbi:MAG: GTPase RsgA, partial [Actinomycetaceae bacterium]|nr:GTPase RsgA [Actinomycetaceae bacterium]
GEVNTVTGKGRHTSTSAISLPLPDGGRIIDTPGVRTFGLAHLTQDDIIDAFPDIYECIEQCPRGCLHQEDTPLCALHQASSLESTRVTSFRKLFIKGIQ